VVEEEEEEEEVERANLAAIRSLEFDDEDDDEDFELKDNNPSLKRLFTNPLRSSKESGKKRRQVSSFCSA